MLLKIQAADLKPILRTLSLADKAAVVIFYDGAASVVGGKLSLSIKRTCLNTEGEQKKFAVSLAKLSEIASNITGEVILEVEDSLTVRAGRSRFKLPLLEASLEPPKFPAGQSYTLPLADIRGMLEFSLIGSGLTNIPFFACDLIQVCNAHHGTGNLQTIGTDGQRLCLSESRIPDVYDTMLIPIQAVRVLMELPGEKARFIETENALFFESEGVIVASPKRIKEFPDIEKIWPKKFAAEFSVDSEAFLAGLKQVAPMASGAIQLSYDGYTLGLFANNEGEAETEIDVKAVYPEPLFEEIAPMAIRLNYKHLHDFFGAVQGEVFVSLNDDKSPLLFTAHAGEDERKMLVVPLV